MRLVEILDNIKTTVNEVPVITEVTICTMEDMIIKVSEKKNKYIGAFVVYDQNNINTGEYSITVPISIIIADKLRTNDNNKVYVHSNTLSASVDCVSLLRVRLQAKGIDGLNNVTQELWSEQFSDSLLAGTKLNFSIQADLKGFCDILT